MPVVELPWAAWYRDATHRLPLPDRWSVDVLAPPEIPACGPQAVERALDAPVESPPLAELARGCRSACLVVDDLARPTRASELLPPVLRRLNAAGLSDAEVHVVVATGSHGGLAPEQLAWKVGAGILNRCRVTCHDCRGPLAATGVMYGERELRINPVFAAADLKVAIGSVLPHSFAGYSGGAKLVLPGLADLEATARSHKFVQLGLRGGSDPGANRFRREAERLAGRLGLNFAVCAIANVQRETVRVVAGDPVAAHRRACAAAREAYRTELSRQYDCAILNAFPKDTDLIQAENAFVAWKTAKAPVVREGGVVVLTTAASEGLGRHGLFEPGGVSFRPPQKKKALGERELWIYAPGLPTQDVRRLYWEGYPAFHSPERLLAALSERLPGTARAAVFPCAPMQQVEDLRN